MGMLTLNHSPGDILRRALISLALGSNPDVAVAGAWPVYCAVEQGSPDNCITVYDSQDGVQSGRMEEETVEFPSVQVKIRAVDHPTAYAKASAIGAALDGILMRIVSMPDGTAYILAWVNRRPFGYIGLEKPASRRHVITINAYLSARIPPED